MSKRGFEFRIIYWIQSCWPSCFSHWDVPLRDKLYIFLFLILNVWVRELSSTYLLNKWMKKHINEIIENGRKGNKKDEWTNLLTTSSYFLSLALLSMWEMVRLKESPNLPAQSSFSDSQASCSNTSCSCSPQLRQCQTLLLLPTSSFLVLKHAAPIGKMQDYTSRASYK